MTAPTQADLEARVIVRMKELSDPKSRWHRSLWTVALVTILDELGEAAAHTWSGVLNSEHALNDFKKSARAASIRDHGVGGKTLQDKLLVDINGVKPESTPESRNAVSRVQEWRSRIARDYLRNWASHIEKQGLQDSEVELTSRCLITYLRSLGYSRSHIQGWLEERGHTLSVAELAREAARNLDGKPRTFDFLVASDKLAAQARRESTLSIVQLDPENHPFHAAENSHLFELSELDAKQAVLLSINAADPQSGLQRLQLRVDRISTRLALAEGKIQKPVPPVVLERKANKLWALADKGELISIPGLRDWNLITALEDVDHADALTETLHLLTPQLQVAHGVSLATLWASCEALLGRRQQGGHLVAPRLASILACAYPRQLAYDLLKRAQKITADGGQLSCRTEGRGSKALPRFWDDIAQQNPGFTDPADLAAYYRFAATLDDPKSVLKRVKNHLEELLLRLYYHRNFVMHSARTNSVSLNDVAGVAPVIVAAALGEMVSGVARGITPASLAERASIELELLGTDAQRHLRSLLG